MHDFRLSQRLRRLFGTDPALDCAGDAPLGDAILALARQAADMHRQLEQEIDDRAWAQSGDGNWPVEGLLTVMEFAALHGIDLDDRDALDSGGSV